MTTRLSVNINAIALLRNRRDLPWPDLVGLARIALEAGAAGITVHPRPDQRHIRTSDLAPIAALVAEFPGAEFNMEGYPSDEFLMLVAQHKPHQVTLVPDDPAQATSDHGWDFVTHQATLRPLVQHIKDQGPRVSMFCDPDAGEKDLKTAADIGADRVELYTGPYAAHHDNPSAADAMLATIAQTAATAQALGLGLNAGHDLTVANLPALRRACPHLLEVSIGHGLTADALSYGMAQAVQRFLQACQA